MATREIYRDFRVLKVCWVLVAVMAIAPLCALRATSYGATITVDSLSDAGLPHICTLRDAINAANTKTRANECIAGTGSDTINFSVTGTIFLANTLPEVSDTLLTINGPAAPGIKISGRGAVQVMTVASGVTLNLNGLTIADGTATGGAGGGINNSGTLTLTNSIFSSNSSFSLNSSGGAGGGIYNDLGTLTVINSTFSGNGATYGGAIFNIRLAQVVVTNSTFSGNSAEYGGGAIEDEGALMVITNSTFSDNSATDGNGGGMDDNSGPVTVTNSTFSGNSAGLGGAILSAPGSVGGYDSAPGGRLNVTSSTFFGNSAYAGGAIGKYGTFGAMIRNTILAGNVGGNFTGISTPAITDGGYNISDDTTCNFSAADSHNNTNPMLDPGGLSHNGGPTKTIALLAGSPAIDAIPLADCTDQPHPPNPLITDQRGFPRPDTAETNCDIGAYEVQDTPPAPFSRFAGLLTIAPDTGAFDLASRFKLRAGQTIDPATQSIMFGIGSYAVRLPAGSFVSNGSGYLYHGTNNGRFLRMSIQPTDMPGIYALIAGGTVTGSTNPVPVTLTIGDNYGSTQINATIN
jgi:hypothetical protein